MSTEMPQQTTDEPPTRIDHPSIPYAAEIVGGLFPGRAVLIRGTVAHSSHRRFTVDFCCGRLVQGDHRDDVALHINPRFEADNQIVINTLVNNTWGMEHRCENTLMVDAPFTLRILVLRDYYKITMNGKLLADFVHRIPVDRVKCLYIEGDLVVELIEYHGAPIAVNSTSLGSSSGRTNDGDFQPYDELRPSVPFMHSITGFMPPRRLKLIAAPRVSATRFEVNFMVGTEYLLHFRVDMPSNQVPKGAIVRNSTHQSRWLKEERDVPFFPFSAGRTFDLSLNAFEKHVEITVDDRLLAVFQYRKHTRPMAVSSLNVNGDLTAQSIQYT